MVNLSFRQLLPRALSRKTSPHRTNNPDDEERPQRGVYLDDGSSGKTPPRLPVELFLKIFEHLGVVDILRCRSACKHFQNVIDHSPEMQYMIELHAAGYVDNPLCTGMGSTARREALKKEARFWRNPKGTWRRTDFPWSVSYEDMRNTNWDDNLWVRFKRNFGAEEGKWNGLQCVAFQPVEGGTPVAERWELTFPFSFVCVSGNPSESMVVLLDLETDPVSSVNENYIIWKVAVRDGTVLSRQTVRFECAPNPGWAEPEISVKGNGVTITRVTHPGVVNAHAHITVLDLETCSYTYTSTRMIRDTCLVAPQHVDDETVLLHMMKDGKFETEVYALVTVLTRDDIPITKLCHVATFGYPQVKSDLITPANGFITGSSGGGLMPNFSVPERPFVRSAVNPLIFLIRYYHDIRHHVTRVTHVFPLSFIQSLVAAFRNTGMHQEVPWSQWGPQSSRCFVDHTTVITGAYGSQILLSDWRMLEFSPQVVSRELMRAGKSSLSRSRRRLRLGRPLRDVELPEGGRIVRRPTVFRKGQVFDQDVVTCMPYRETQLSRVSANPALVFGGEVWVACTTEVDEDGFTRHNCYTLEQ